MRPFVWKTIDVAGVTDETALSRFFTDALSALAKLTKSESGYCAIAGIQAGSFKAVSRFGVPDERRVRSDLDALFKTSREAEKLPGLDVHETQISLPLTANGALWGLIRLWGNFCTLNPEIVLNWSTEFMPAVTKRISLLRAWQLQQPLVSTAEPQLDTSFNAVLDRVAETAAKAFGADGTVLARYDREQELFFTGAMVGDLRLGDFTEGGQIVFNTRQGFEEEPWYAIEISNDIVTRGGVVDQGTIEHLRLLGVRALLCGRLSDPLYRDLQGLLICYFTREHLISFDDIVLFLAFCENASAAINVAHEISSIAERNRVFALQSARVTQVEIVHLLLHDFSHKVLNLESSGLDLIDLITRRYVGQAKLNDDVHDSFVNFKNVLSNLKDEIIALRGIGRLGDYDALERESRNFFVEKTIRDVIRQLHGALEQQKISVKLDVAGEPQLYGSEQVLQHVLLNLMVNTIDAAKTRKTTRPMQLHFRILDQPDLLKIRIWDTGPGINQALFKSMEEVFKIGRTSKPSGTGLGLAVARNLITRYFRGSISLIDPRTAAFEIVVKKSGAHAVGYHG
jgi:signal transduction histidine kinase